MIFTHSYNKNDLITFADHKTDEIFLFSRFFFNSNLNSNYAAFDFLTNFNIVSTEPLSAQWLNEGDDQIFNFAQNLSVNTEILFRENEEIDFYFKNKIPDLSVYSFYTKPSFISFFVNNFIDVPICFKKSKSLRRKNFELPLLKICTLLMKKGKKEKTIKFFFTSFRAESSVLLEDFPLFANNFFWTHDYLLLISCLFVQNDGALFFLKCDKIVDTDQVDQKEQITENTDLTTNAAISEKELIIKNKILKNLSFVNPVFAYFIYSVDKNVRKFSRGKSGKYRFVWKYIAPYKRKHVVLKWLAKEIKFINEKTFQKRLVEMFRLLNHAPESSFTWKSKNFSHNYVFRNFKKTLMTRLQTIS